MRQVGDGIYRLGTVIHNFYVVAEGGKATVVDAGCSKELPKLEQGLALIGMKLDDVEAIILPHAHADHIGFAAEANDGGTEGQISEIEGPIATGDQEGHEMKVQQLPLWKLGTWRFLYRPHEGRRYEGTSRQVGRHLQRRRRPRLAGQSKGRVLPRPLDRPRIFLPAVKQDPAHRRCPRDPRSAQPPRRRSATQSGRVPHPRSGLPDVFHTDPAQYRASLETLSALDTELILPGHGSPYHGQIAEAAKTALG